MTQQPSHASKRETPQKHQPLVHAVCRGAVALHLCRPLVGLGQSQSSNAAHAVSSPQAGHMTMKLTSSASRWQGLASAWQLPISLTQEQLHQPPMAEPEHLYQVHLHIAI